MPFQQARSGLWTTGQYFFDPRDLPAATSPSFDPAVLDDLPLDEDGVPVLPDDFDRSQLPGYN